MANDIVTYEGDAQQDDTAKYTIDPYLDLVTWQHQKAKFLETITQSIRGQAQEINLLLGIAQLFDVDTAVGEQLDYTGQWIGVSRYITTSLRNVYFSWDDDTVGFDQGVWWQPYSPTTEFYMLDDEHYRFLLKAKIVSNHWDGTIPNAYESWDALFAEEDFQVLIQDGMASAIAQFKFDTDDREGWNSGSWQRFDARTNFIRNSALVDAVVGVDSLSDPGDLPKYWGLRTGLDFFIESIYDIYDTINNRMIDVLNLVFSGTTIDVFSDIYFEELNYLAVTPGQVYTLSSYFQVTIPDSTVNHYTLVFRTYFADGSLHRDYESSLDEAPTIIKRGSFTLTIPDRVKTIRVGIRLSHGAGVLVGRLGLLIGQPQLELSDTVTVPIRTTGSALVVYEEVQPEAFLNSVGHMMYALIAPYSPPPPALDYFTWDTYISEIILGEITNNRILGTPTVDESILNIPPGLTLCLPCTDPNWPEVANETPISEIKGTHFYVNAHNNILGARFDQQGYTTYSWNAFGAEPPSVWTIEVIVHLFSGVDGYIAGFTNYAKVSNVSDRTLYIANGKFGVYVGGGGTQHIELGIAEAGIHHIIATCEPPNVTLYVKNYGSLVFQNDTGGRNDYYLSYRIDERDNDRITEDGASRFLEEPVTAPGELFFAVGRARTDTPYSFLPIYPQAFDGVLLMANVSTEAYSSGVVTKRFDNPYDFLWWQQPDVEVITADDPSRGWDVGYWDGSSALVTPPPIDAVTMALFTGGYIDLRPAGVAIDYVTQSLAGTPIFAFDVLTDITIYEPNYLTWDGDDANGWDTGVWDGTQATFDSNIAAPPTYLSGWDIGAWGAVYKPPEIPIIAPYREQSLAA